MGDKNIYIDLKPGIPALPKVEDKTMVDVRYALISPYAFAHIYWDKKENEMIYELEEPILNDEEKDILQKIETGMREVININVLVEKTTEAMIDYIDKTAELLISELSLNVSIESYRKMFYYLFRNFIGFNEIEPLMRDYFIEDIECNGINTPVYIIHRIYRSIKTNITFRNIEHLASFVEKLAQRCGRYISYASPLLDGSLEDGTRVNATYTADVTSKGPTFCFKDGYIQLSDGRIKKIKEMYEEAKKNFGFKEEDGNEVVEVSNLNCCGIGKELEQKDCMIKSIIKLKSAKLFRISFEDGGEIEVTPEHLFHVAEDSLKLIPAKELKQGMCVPMPKKINVCGYRQKIDVYSLIKDFSYSKKISIISTNQIKSMIANEIALNNKGKNYRQILSQKYNVGNSYFYEIMHRGSSLSFQILDSICQGQNVDFNALGDIAVSVYGGGTKNKSKAIKIPLEIDEDLAYLAGALVSDGHLSKEYAYFLCFEEGFKKAVKEKLLNKFGRFDSYYNDSRFYLCNLFIPFFFNRIFSIPIGKKSYNVKIPDRIFKSDNKVISAFIRGLFDGDGTCKGGLNYRTYSKELAEGLTYLLARLGIYSYLRKEKEGYRVNIPSPYYIKYSELINFENYEKKTCLKNMIEKQTEHKTFIRHDRIPSLPIINIIKKLGVNKTQLLKECDFNWNRITYPSFSKTFAIKLMNRLVKEKNISKAKEEVDYIKWLMSSEQEFVRIKSIEEIENSEPVYDLEIEPCKFFIAGNKPMNIFDTLRKFTKVPWTPPQLIALNTLSPEMCAYFWLLIQYKCNILITGGTASGKTSLLNAIAFFIPPEARVVSIEDTRELHLPRENWLPAVARTSIGIGKVGEIDLFDLLKSSFRQNPDYVIVGEVRGKEAFVLFQGMASGHASISTIHADSVDTVIKRLETPPIELSPTLVNTLDAVAIMTHAIVKKQQTRRLRSIVEIVKVDPNGIALTNTPFIWNPQDDKFYFKKDSKVFEKIMTRYGMTKEELVKEFELRTKLLNEFFKKKVFNLEKIQEEINEYYKNPADVLRRYGIKS